MWDDLWYLIDNPHAVQVLSDMLYKFSHTCCTSSLTHALQILLHMLYKFSHICCTNSLTHALQILSLQLYKFSHICCTNSLTHAVKILSHMLYKFSHICCTNSLTYAVQILSQMLFKFSHSLYATHAITYLWMTQNMRGREHCKYKQLQEHSTPRLREEFHIYSRIFLIILCSVFTLQGNSFFIIRNFYNIKLMLER